MPHAPERVASILVLPDHPWTVALDGDGVELLARVGVRVGQVPVYKHVRLTVGRPQPSPPPGERLMLPVNWEAAGGPPIFPAMEGTLHVAPAAPGQTRLTLNACYDPPLGALGAILDRALLHRLGQATVEDFVKRLAASLEAELSRPS